MNPVDVKNLALAHKSEWRTYTEIGKLLKISRNLAINLCSYKNKMFPKKRGPQFTLSKTNKLSIKRIIGTLKETNGKINSKKLKIECGLDVPFGQFSSTWKQLVSPIKGYHPRLS